MPLFGSIAILSGILVTNFPETFNIKLPDTIEEAESIGKARDNVTKENIKLEKFTSIDHKIN